MNDNDEPRLIDWNWVFDIPDGWSDSRWVVVDGKVAHDNREEE